MIFWTKPDGMTYVYHNGSRVVHPIRILVLYEVSAPIAIFRDVTMTIYNAEIKHIELQGLCDVTIHSLNQEYTMNNGKADKASKLMINGKQIDIFV